MQEKKVQPLVSVEQRSMQGVKTIVASSLQQLVGVLKSKPELTRTL